MVEAVVSCDLCRSSQVVKAGSNSYGEQVYQCNNQAHGRHRFKVRQNILKTEIGISLDAHVCAILEEAKNMTEASTISRLDAGKTGNLIEYAWTLKKKNKKENTIKLRVYYLEWLRKKGANLASPSSVETILATELMKTAQKFLAVAAYKSYCKVMKILWEDPPKIDYQPKEPFIPITEEVNALITAAGKRTATFLQVAATTGAREGEICRLK